MPNTDIIPLGSSCSLCGRGGGERHGADCAIGSPAGRALVRVRAALAQQDVTAQARQTMTILEDAAADCENDSDRTHALMTLAEAAEAYSQMQTEEATSIALDGLETLFSVSFVETPVDRPAPMLSATTLTLCERAIDNRLTEVEAERERLLTYRPEAREHAQHLLELDTEVRMIQDALAELGRVLALTPGASAA